MVWTVIIRLWTAAALALAGAQFTHAGELHAGLGHLGHQHDTGIVDFDVHNHGPQGHGDHQSVPEQPDNPLGAEGGLHCGAPLMAVFGQDIPTSRLPLQMATPVPAKPLLTTRFNLDPPPPRG